MANCQIAASVPAMRGSSESYAAPIVRRRPGRQRPSPPAYHGRPPAAPGGRRPQPGVRLTPAWPPGAVGRGQPGRCQSPSTGLCRPGQHRLTSVPSPGADRIDAESAPVGDALGDRPPQAQPGRIDAGGVEPGARVPHGHPDAAGDRGAAARRRRADLDPGLGRPGMADHVRQRLPHGTNDSHGDRHRDEPVLPGCARPRLARR